MSQIFYFPSYQALAISGAPLPGAKLGFFLTGTGTATPVYADAARTTTLSNPVVADAQGRFPQIYPNPDIIYRVRLTDSSNVQQWQEDGVSLQLFPATAAEIAAVVTPVNYAYRPYTSKRHDLAGDDTANDASKIQGMLDSARESSINTSSGGRAVFDGSGLGRFRCGMGLTFDPLHVALDGQGVVLTFDGITTPYVGLTLDSQLNLGEPTIAPLYRGVRPLENLLIVNPSYLDNADSTGVLITDSTGVSGSYQNSGGSIRNLSICGGQYGLVMGNGTYGWDIENLRVLNDFGHDLHTCVYSPSSNTDIEANHFRGGFMGNSVYGFDYETGYALVSGMTIDGTRTIARLSGTGHLKFVGCYTEAVEGDDTQYKAEVSDTNGILEFESHNFNVRGDHTRTLAWFNCSAGLLLLRNCTFTGGLATNYFAFADGFLAIGSGTVRASGLTYSGFGFAPLPHRTLQWLPYPDIDNANALATCTLDSGGAANPVRATSITDGFDFRDAIKFQINNGAAINSYSRLKFTKTALVPGKRLSIVGSGYTGGTFGSSHVALACQFIYKDSAGNTLTMFSEILLNSTDWATWTTFGSDGSFVPAGAASVEVTLQTVAGATVAGNTTLYVSPLGIGYADGEC